VVQSLPTTPAEDDDAPSEISKRDKRRAKEAKKKAAEEAEHLARKEARKAGRKAQAAPDTLAEQNDKLRKDDGRSRNDEDFTTPRTKKGKGKQIRSQQLPDEFSEEKVARAVQAIKTNREKMLDKWGENWNGELSCLCSLSGRSVADHISSVCPE
jgi:DnaJ family protein A protein 5